MPLRSARTLESESTFHSKGQRRKDTGRNLAGFSVLAAIVFSALLLSPGWAMAEGTTAAPTAERPPTAVSLPLAENQRCLECHGDKALSMTRGDQTTSLFVDGTAYNDSRHGVIACVRCHEAVQNQSLEQHKLSGATALTGRDLKIAISKEECTKCHAGPILETYQQSFHWAGLNLGGTSTASCADCHDAHQALPASDARSTTAPANLPATCGQSACHPGADAALTSAAVHTSPQTQGPWSPARLIWKAFIILILFDTLKDGPIILFELIRRLRSGKASHTTPREVGTGV